MTQYVSYDPVTYFSNRGTAIQPPFVSGQQPSSYDPAGFYNGVLTYPQFLVFPNTTNPVTETVIDLGLSSGGSGAALIFVPAAGVGTFECIGIGGNTDLGIIRTPTHVIIGSVSFPIFSLASAAAQTVLLTWQIQPNIIAGTYAFDGGPSGNFSYAPRTGGNADLIDLTVDGLGPTGVGDIWVDADVGFPDIPTNPIFNGKWIGNRPMFFFTVTDVVGDAVTYNGYSEVCHDVDQCNMSFNG